jgi:hypothetical protein
MLSSRWLKSTRWQRAHCAAGDGKRARLEVMFRRKEQKLSVLGVSATIVVRMMSASTEWLLFSYPFGAPAFWLAFSVLVFARFIISALAQRW